MKEILKVYVVIFLKMFKKALLTLIVTVAQQLLCSFYCTERTRPFYFQCHVGVKLRAVLFAIMAHMLTFIY